MVKTVELMGLATFNIFVALTLSATVLSGANKENTNSVLTESNITTFINDVATISGGLKTDMDEHNIVEYFIAHMTKEGRVKASISYKMDNQDEQQRDMDMGRMDYISHILQGMKTMQKHETKTRIDYIKVAEDGKSARVVTTNYERGIMPTEDAFGDMVAMPVLGTSYCEQNIVLSPDRVIQMDGAECTTSISFEESF